VERKKCTVCLDPGHGPGTVNGSPDGSYKEQEFCWDMYTRIKPLLEKQGITVVGTRGQNEKPSLINRCKVSDNAKVDLFLSIHSNAEGGIGWGSASGLIVLTSSGPDAAQRNVAARVLLNRFREAGMVIRGNGLDHNIDLVVIAKTDAPACLIEYGFHTNQGDVSKLKDPAYRDKLAVATAKGVCDYLGVAYKEDKSSETPTARTLPEAVKWAVEQGIILGDDNGNLGLGNTLTKEQGCTMLHRFYQLITSGK